MDSYEIHVKLVCTYNKTVTHCCLCMEDIREKLLLGVFINVIESRTIQFFFNVCPRTFVHASLKNGFTVVNAIFIVVFWKTFLNF